jgi:tetratricopeptide (TPR) repeat protein
VMIFVLTFGIVLKKESNSIRVGFYVLTGLLSFWVLLLLSFKVLWWLLLVSTILLLMYGVSLVRQVRVGWLSVLFFFLTTSIVFIFFGTPKFVQLNVPTEVALGMKPSGAVVWSTLTSGVKTFAIGSGLGSFGVDFSQFRNPIFNSDSVAWSLRFNQPFNTFLAIASEGGALLTFAMVFLVLIAVGHVFSIWNKIRTAALNHESPDFSQSSILFEAFLVTVAFLVLTIGSFLVFYSQVLWWAWWLLLALAVSGFSFYYRTFLHESELILEDTPQYSLSFSFGLIVAMTALVMVSVFGARLYLAEVNFAKAMQSKNYKQAEMFLSQSIENRPNSDTYHAALAQVYLNEAVDLSKNANPDVSAISGLVAKAVNEAKAATDLSPKSVALWENLATMYENASAIVPEARDWAFKTLSQARDLEPTNPTLWWRLGNSYAATAKWDDAIKHYQKSIELKPDYFGAYVGLSNAYEQTQKFDLAIGVFEKLISQNKVNAEIMYNYGRLLYNRNSGADRENALKIWLKVVEQQPNYSNALYSIGLWYENKGDLTNAFKYYYKVRDLNPNNRNILDKINKLLGASPAVQNPPAAPQTKKK